MPIERHPVLNAASLVCASRSGMIYEDVPHKLSGGGEEMRAILPGDMRLLNHPRIRFVNQRRGLKRMVAPLGPHVVASQAPQLVIDLSDELLLGRAIARTQLDREGGDRVLRSGTGKGIINMDREERRSPASCQPTRR